MKMSGWVNVLGKVCVCACSVASAWPTLCDPMSGSPHSPLSMRPHKNIRVGFHVLSRGSS